MAAPRRLVTVVCALALGLAPARAVADAADAGGGSTPGADADRLFVEGSELVEQGRFAEACPKLARSQELDPAIGTEFNLAHCYEKVGRYATAWRMFREVAHLAHAAGKAEREQASVRRADALEPKLARLAIDVSGAGVSARDLTLKVDGAEVAAEERGRPYPVDPGDHTVEVAAQARKPWTTTVDRVTDGQSRSVIVPKLEAIAGAAAPQRGGTQRSLALAIGGVGLAGLATGAVTGILAIVKHGQAKDACPDPDACASQADADRWTSATTMGTVSTIAFAVGGVAVAAAGVLWLTSPRGNAPPPKERTALWIAPLAGPGAAGAALGVRLP